MNNLTRGFQTVHLGHLKVKDNQVVVAGFKAPHRLSAVAGFVAHAPAILLLKQAAKVASHCWIVVG